MVLTFVVSWFLHTYLLVVENDGFQKDSWASPYLNLQSGLGLKGNFLSSLLIWAGGSAFVWSFLLTSLQAGPVRAVSTIIDAPLRMVRVVSGAGQVGRGAGLLGVGLALLVSRLFPLNSSANVSLALTWTLIALSTSQQTLSTIPSPSLQEKLKSVQGMQLMIAGIAPGFLLAAFLPTWLSFTIGLVLFLGGVVLWATPRGSGTSPGQMRHLLLIGILSTFIHWFLEALLAPSAFANDGGSSEAGGLSSWPGSEGSGEAVARGVPPALAAAGGSLVPGTPLTEDTAPKSEHPECDELYARLKAAIGRYRDAQREREATWQRLERARRIHAANQAKLILRYGTEIGQIAGAGVEGIRSAGRNINRGATDFADDMRGGKARAEMLAEPVRQIRARLAEIERLMGDLSTAQSLVDGLLQEHQALNNWAYQETAQWYSDHPSLTGGPGLLTRTDLAEIETNRIARQQLLDEIARQGYGATQPQRKRLADLLRDFRAAQRRQLDREVVSGKRGWVPDLETHLSNRDPQKYQRWRTVDAEVNNAEQRLATTERAAPPALIDERDRLRTQLSDIQAQEAQGSLPEGFSGRGPRSNTQQIKQDDVGKQRGSGTQQGTIPTPPSSTLEPPQRPEWLEILRQTGEGTVSDILAPVKWVLSPIGRLWHWAFVGKQQSPEEIGRLLREGMDTINRLTQEFEAKQREIDNIRAEVDRMKEGLERCNKLKNPSRRKSVSVGMG